MPDTNDRLKTLEEARRIIEDNLVVMAHLEKKQSEMLKPHAEIIADIDERQQKQSANGKVTDERIEKLVFAIGAFNSRQ